MGRLYESCAIANEKNYLATQYYRDCSQKTYYEQDYQRQIYDGNAIHKARHPLQLNCKDLI